MIPEKGHVFHGPDGQGYKFTTDAVAGERIRPSHFEAFGGAPDPETWMVPGAIVYWPEWLSDQLRDMEENQ